LLLQENNVDKRLAVFYLFDTLCKNRRLSAVYRPLLSPHIAAPFISSYKYANEVTRKAMDKLLSAWRTNSIFSSAILDSMQSRIAAAQHGGQHLAAPQPAAADPRKREGAPPADDIANKVRLQAESAIVTAEKQPSSMAHVSVSLCCAAASASGQSVSASSCCRVCPFGA
jgi:hypothetical protein